MKFDSHHRMSKDEVIAFVLANTKIFNSTKNLKCEEIGDGNINYIYRIYDEKTSQSIILKQADNQTRVRPDSYLNPNRSTREAEVLNLEYSFAPSFVPIVLHHDKIMATIIMEDIGSYSNLKKELINGQTFKAFGKMIAEFIVNTCLPLSDIVIGYEKKMELASKFYNPDLCKISQNLVFTDPYTNARKRNILFEANKEFLEEKFYKNKDLHKEVAKLKEKFNNYQQSLIHGDLHSGSIFVKNEKYLSIKVIDPEFAFYGPIAYDLGNILAHLTFAEKYWEVANDSLVSNYSEAKKNKFLKWVEKTKKELLEEFSKQAKIFLDKNITDPLYKNKDFINEYVENIRIDAISFCGTELNRRVIGSAKTQEITSINDAKLRVKLEKSIVNDAIKMILKPKSILKKILS